MMLPFSSPYGVPTWAIKFGVVLILAGGLFATGWFKGASHVKAKWEAEHQAMTLAASQQAQQQAVVTVNEVIKYIDREKVVQGRTQTIVKEVPIYVTAKNDADCAINNGFVRLHNAAATNTVPDGPRDTDATTAALALSTVAEVVAGNYGTCHENAEQLRALQSWVLAMSAANGR